MCTVHAHPQAAHAHMRTHACMHTAKPDDAKPCSTVMPGHVFTSADDIGAAGFSRMPSPQASYRSSGQSGPKRAGFAPSVVPS